MERAQKFAESLGAKLTIPSKPLLFRKKGEAVNYFAETHIAERIEAMKSAAALVELVQRFQPRRVK